jgi:hypothetical protein
MNHCEHPRVVQYGSDRVCTECGCKVFSIRELDRLEAGAYKA